MYTLSEAAKKIKLTTSALRYKIKAGTLKAIKRGGVWFISRREIERLQKKSN
jgi:DNA-binding transcriptional MerR regulator